MNQKFVRGGIYLANLNPSSGAEIGKIRPVLVIQSNQLNNLRHTTVNILPLSTNLKDNTFLRFRVRKQDRLEHNSDVVCDYIRAIDANKFTSEMLTQLSRKEMQEIEEKLGWILGFND
ncbi:MAG: type II toxin-antitoxin system PemK/MazF family toxin [Candidatus Thioglobus sp.]|nr:type II toxin-antitoxin system PemK/MazF family toxin [Candidatus Thioglobus sp.]